MVRTSSAILVVALMSFGLRAADAPPKVHDDRLRVDLFASSPDIVHPVGIAFDARGRLLVIESHTHFAPKDYKGPKHDRIRILEDTDGDGKADRFSTFFEGTKHTMDIAVHPDGSVLLATRNEILRLRDTKNAGKADVKERLVFLDTKGDYPHNGLSGLCFDSRGNFFFGMGENLGADYKLIGSDGTTIAGGGEGGGIFHCTADGKKLRRVATGFWNPFGVCRDIFGRTFAVDNDADSMPPCRMVHVVEGGDYGFQFRYGRSGRHPFQAWNGQLPGTLPMMSGTGEAPCAFLSYESDGLPRNYLGQLLVASWADHRVERYVVRPQGSSFTAERKPFVQGGNDFRPVGLAVAPDGTLFVSDWVLSNYNLHGKGAVWHVRPKEAVKPDRPEDPRKALTSLHRPLRESAARKLAGDEKGREFLRGQLESDNVRIRAAALTALIDAGDEKTDLKAIALGDRDTGVRALAVRAASERGTFLFRNARDAVPPELTRESVPSFDSKRDQDHLRGSSVSDDPFLCHAAIQHLARQPELLDLLLIGETNERRRISVLIAHRASGRPEGKRLIPTFLKDSSDEVRFLTLKWISDELLKEHRPRIVEIMKERNLNVRLFVACSTALARIDGQEVNDARLTENFLVRLNDEKSSPSMRVLALQTVPATHPKLSADLLGKFLAGDDPALQREAVRTLRDHPTPKRGAMLLDVLKNEKLSNDVRAHAISGLSEKAADRIEDLFRLMAGDKRVLADEAVRALTNVKLSDKGAGEVEQLVRGGKIDGNLAARVLGKPFYKDRPPTKEIEAWLKRLDGPSDIDAGRRVFFHPKLASCYRCHRVEGRGHEVGPDLDTVGRNEKGRILESILQPSAVVAPHYQNWQITTEDGKVRSGMLTRTYLDEYTYLDAKGELFKVKTGDVADLRPSPTSIMPDGLVNLLTDQELRDLFAYLCSRR